MEQQASLPARRSAAGRLALQLALLGLSVNAAVALADVQRMLIESQSFSIPAGGKAEPKAMCLDASSSSPSPATRFGLAPKDLGDIRVTTPDGKQMSLQAALDKHIVEVRGTQGYSAVEFRNLLTSGELKVNVVHNSVVIPDASYRTADLKGLPELQGTRLVSQSALWESRSVQMGMSRSVQMGQTQAAVAVSAARAAAPAAHAQQAPVQAPVEEVAAPPPPPTVPPQP
jgi:hypothetical protein